MRRRRNRRRMSKRLHAEEIADRPPQRRGRAELSRVLNILETISAPRVEMEDAK